MRVFVVLLLFACFVPPGMVTVEAGEYDDSDCAICHEEVVEAFGRTGHAIAPGWEDSMGCQSCHGPGEAHIDGGGDPEAIVRPQELPPRESSDGCLSCHRRHEGHFSARRAIHRLDDVACVDCHNPHSTAQAMLARAGAELCAECHRAVAGRFELPRAHPMADGGPGCVSCHDPHATRTLRGSPSLAVRTCERCHFEKVGPFIYDHGTLLLDGCSACHQVHGSTNRHLLRHETQVNLCYECHTASVTPGWHSASRFLDEKCTACHSAIHGSNTNQLFLEE